MRGRTITLGVLVLAAVVLVESTMGTFKPSVKLRRHYTITNAAELAPVITLVSQFLTGECPNEHTRRAYEMALGYFMDYCSKRCGRGLSLISYSDINRALITDFRDARLRIESPASAELRLRAVRTFCSWCADRFQVPNPGLRIKSVYQPENSFKGLTAVEVAAVLRETKRREPLERFVPILLLETGLRNDEARNLTIKQIDRDASWINRVVGKSAKPRDIFISDTLRHELTEYLYWRKLLPSPPDSPLLPSSYRATARRVPKLSNKTIWRIVNDVCTAAGVREDVSHPHALRHTFAYRTLDHLESKGLKSTPALLKLGSYLGHESILVTTRYLGNDKTDDYELLRDLR